MKIGIIGAGNIGATLARMLAAAGHEIKLANSKSPESIRELAAKVGATATTKQDAVAGVDIVILSVPFSAHRDLADLFANVPENVVVVDTSNYYPFRDGAIADVDGGKPEAVWVSEQINRPIVKAWNAVLSATLAEKGVDKSQPGRIALPVAGDDLEKKSIVMLIPFPVAFFVGTLVTDILHSQSGDPFWPAASNWMLAAGLVMMQSWRLSKSSSDFRVSASPLPTRRWRLI